MGRVIADALGGELDVVLVRKLGAPGKPEVAIGSVDEHGGIALSDFARTAGADAGYLRREAESSSNCCANAGVPTADMRRRRTSRAAA
jgi:putative phosphoribosyl transferase